MKRIFACILLAMASLSAFAADSKGYNIKLNVTNSSMANQKVYLAFYFNGKTYSKDTTTLNNKGVGYFSKKTALDQGVYIVYFDANKFFDVLIGADQNLELKIDTAKLDKVVVSGAK